MIQRKIYHIIRRHFAKVLDEFERTHNFSEDIIRECTRSLVHIVKDEPQVIKYELLDNKKGLYVKQNKKFINPCYIVAGGSSLKEFNFELLKYKTTIVSNKAIFDVPNPSYFITTDYTFLNYLKKENLYETWKDLLCMKFFVGNCISNVIQITDGQITDVRYNLKYSLQDFDRIIICKSAKSVGYDFNNFNSGYNSGFSSFQLAILLGYNPIYLLGMDMASSNGDTHYHGGYGRDINRMNINLDNYSKHFLNVLEKLKIEKPNLKVISCSSVSLLNQVIEYKPIEEIL